MGFPEAGGALSERSSIEKDEVDGRENICK